jgi:release factor glutamine methyltransferase
VADRLQLFESDVFRELDAGRYDLIASNPPYVPAAQFSGLQDEVRDFEPRAALTDGGDGLSIIAEIIRESPTHLFNGGNLLMEIGFDQSKAVERLFEPSLWDAVDLMPDLQGIPRLVRAVLK